MRTERRDYNSLKTFSFEGKRRMTMHQRSTKSAKQAYREYLKSDHWSKLRSTKNKTRCAICGLENERMDVHHLIYRNWYDCISSDLRKVCQECHIVTHILIELGRIKYFGQNHNSIYATTKSVVKMARFGGNHMHAREVENILSMRDARQDSFEERDKIVKSVKLVLGLKPFRPFGVKLTGGRVFSVKDPDRVTIHEFPRHTLVVMVKKITKKKKEFFTVKPSRIESIIPLSAPLTLLAA